MKHLVHLGPRRYSVNSELEYKFAVVGQRNRENEVVAPPEPLKGDATTEQRQKYQGALRARMEFVKNDTGGRYAEKVIDWSESEEGAASQAQAFRDKGWLNVRIVPVETTIQNA